MPAAADGRPLTGLSSLGTRTLVVGCGDVGLRVAKLLPVTAVVRSAESVDRLAREGVRAVAVDLDLASPNSRAAGQDVFWFAPPPDRGTTDPRVRRFASDRDAAPPRRVVYLSTSAVYGDCGGRWIDEDAPLEPSSDRGRRRLDAESSFRRFAASTGTELVILRVPGIYGPGRLPVERLKKGLPVVAEDESPWTNRIHADDLAAAAVAAMERGRPGSAYNIADGNPTSMADYFSRCARLLGLPEPPRVSLAEARTALTPAMMSFLEESKRLDVRRMREELEFEPRYPDLAAGLRACA